MDASGADAFGSSTAPLTWHDFLDRMRQPSATEFVKSIKSFIVSFLNNEPDAEKDSAAVQTFLANMEAAFRAHPLWAGSSEEELESAGEGLEKYVMTKLFTRVFASLPEDVKADEQLYHKISLVQQFIRPENLDIKPIFQNEASWLLAQKELQKINSYRAPRDKLVCILNCCKVINNLLLNASSLSNGDPPGADDFLPVLIYVTIKANPPQLHSNLAYIQRYRRQTRLVSEAAYFFTNILSAESFITNMDAKSLSMDENEFERNMVFAEALLSGLSGGPDNPHTQSDQNAGPVPRSDHIGVRVVNPTKHQVSVSSSQLSLDSSRTKTSDEESHVKDRLPKEPSLSDLENKGASMLLEENNSRKVFQDFPFLYAQAGDLTVQDVEDLLNNYKQLVFKYVSLAKGLGVENPPAPSVKEVQLQIQHEKAEGPKDIGEMKLTEDKHENLENPSQVLPEAEKLDSLLSEIESVSSQTGEKNDEPER